MMSLRFGRYTLGVCAAASMLTACQGPPPIGAAPQPAYRAAWMAPSAGKRALLYVTGGCHGTCVFSYPGGRLVGHLGVAGAGLCSDKHGNIFVPTATGSGQAVVYEYAHGGTTPIATSNVPGLLAEGCSADPTTGNLAVTYLCQNCDYGPVAIFQNAQGSPTSYEQAGVFLSYCGYDNKGNLFADGSSGSQVALVELPKAGTSLKPITLNQHISVAGQVQWDGTYLAVEDLSNPVIYQFKVSGSAAKRVGTTHLMGTGSTAAQSWIQAGTVVVPFGANTHSPNEVGFWNYPAGGAATKVIKKHLSTSLLAGATVSEP
jgi:hypothetical protein